METTNMIRKMQNIILAICLEVEAMSVKPKTAAMIETIKNTKTHCNIKHHIYSCCSKYYHGL